MLTLIEQLLWWQWINSVMDGIGFGLSAIVILWLAVKVMKLEERVRGLGR